MADIKYLVQVDDQGGLKKIQQFDDSLEQVTQTSKKTEKAQGGLWKQVALGQFAYAAVKKAGREFVDFLKDSIKAAMEQEKADKALDAALEITGRKVAGLSEHFKRYASELQKSTIYGDEVIEGAQALLIQLTNLDKQGLDRATKGAIGLASVMGMDLSAASQLVAKAMSGNASALTRYGIQIDQTKTKEEQRAEILDKLEQFYGRATAETETYSGKVAQLKNVYGDIQEEVGFYITRNHALMESLNAVANAILFQLTLHARLAQAKATVIDKENEWSDSLAAAAVEAGLAYGEMGKLITQYNGNTIALARAIAKGKEGLALQQALKKVRTDEIQQFTDLQKKQRELERGTNKFTVAVKKADKAEGAFTKEIQKSIPAARQFSDALMNIIPPLDGIVAGEQRAGFASQNFSKTFGQSMDEFVAKANEAFEQYGAAAGDAFNLVNQLVNQTYANKSQKMENDYNRQVDLINKSTMSEEEKAAALTALDEEFELKRRDLAAKQAKSQRTLSAANALISTFEAAAKAYTAGPIIGPILAGIITAMGLGLVAKIKSAPLPLAKGGIFDKPTLLPMLGGGTAQVAEAGEKEVVAPLSGLRRELGIGRGGGTEKIITHHHHHLYLDGKEMKVFITKTIKEQSQLGKLKIRSKVLT